MGLRCNFETASSAFADQIATLFHVADLSKKLSATATEEYRDGPMTTGSVRDLVT